MADNDLTIPESILLLALNDETGERKGEYVEYVLFGAALTELLLLGRIDEIGEPPKKLALVDPKPVGEPYLDACLAALEAKGSGKNAKAYIESLGGKSSLARLLYERLIQRGILSEHKSSVLLLFTHTTYPEANPAPELALKKRLKAAITGQGPVDVRDSVIICLANSIDILKYNFDRDELKAHKARIKKIADCGLLPPGATIATVRSMQSAAALAAIMPAVLSTTST